MAEQDQLCDICSAIPFDSNNPPFGHENPSTASLRGLHFTLGSGHRIRTTVHCPLCRLISYALSNARIDVQDIEIGIAWDYHLCSPAGGFRVLPQSPFGCNIFLVTEPSHNSGHDAGAILPISSNQLDFERTRSWLKDCIDNHPNCTPVPAPSAENTAFPKATDFRLIDVHQQCIVNASIHWRYLALSYVWGGVQGLRLTTNNMDHLTTPGAFKNLRWKIPKTVRDAMELVASLRERYLWVDALCLVQNDIADMLNGLAVMDLVYENATMTVIASCCNHANDTLPGVQSGTRYSTQLIEEILPGIKLAAHFELDPILQYSSYFQRAWTFQEQRLSPRALFFINNQVYFRCSHSQRSEDRLDRSWVVPLSTSVSSPAKLAEEQTPILDYRILLFYYTQRTLSNQNDVHRALMGIMRRFSVKSKSKFFQGVPASAFDSFMLFKAKMRSGMLRRRVGFPSYSWMGWIGQVTFNGSFSSPIEMNKWLSRRTWIIWYKKTLLYTTHPVWDISENASFLSATWSDVGYRERLPFTAAARLGIERLPTEPTREEIGPPLRPYPLLQFWTLTIYLSISEFQVFTAEAYICDKQKQRCGVLNMDDFENDTFFKTDTTYEFIVLSEENRTFSGSLSIRDCPYYKDGPSIPGSWRYYHVLVLQFKDGARERRGYGLIYQSAIHNSLSPGPIWKEITLA